MIFRKKGFIYKPSREADWWSTNAMAPAAFVMGDSIRVLVGGWDEYGISRIGYIDVSADNPSHVLAISREPVLDIGDPGCFDDNGVFPGHVYVFDGKVYLYYTGFQKLDKIPFSNFSGLAISEDGGNTFKRISRAPVMDRADEGLYTRAGTSIIHEDGIFKSCYSVGSSWYFVNGKQRPVYDINYSESPDGISFPSVGRKIIECDLSVEHGLGRPQLVKHNGRYFVFYTRRLLDYRYHIGVSESKDCIDWTRKDEFLAPISFGKEGEFDSDMIYFPCFVEAKGKGILFYCGNGYGKDGFGYAEVDQ